MPVALLALAGVFAAWILVLRWRPRVGCAIGALVWVGLTLVVFPVAWAQSGEDFCSGRGRSFQGPSDQLFPPTFTCEFVRADGSTFTRDYHSDPAIVVLGTAVFGIAGVAGFAIAACHVKRRIP